jgi:hypothetical protein
MPKASLAKSESLYDEVKNWLKTAYSLDERA